MNIYKERIEDLEQTKNRNAFLENEIIHLRKQNDKLLNDHGQISDMQKHVEFNQKIALKAKTELNVAKMETQKLLMQIEKIENEKLDTARQLERSENRSTILESELLENQTRLSVYERLESSSRLKSL